MGRGKSKGRKTTVRKEVKRMGHKAARQAERQAEETGKTPRIPQPGYSNSPTDLPLASLPDLASPPSNRGSHKKAEAKKAKAEARSCPKREGTKRHNYIKHERTEEDSLRYSDYDHIPWLFRQDRERKLPDGKPCRGENRTYEVKFKTCYYCRKEIVVSRTRIKTEYF